MRKRIFSVLTICLVVLSMSLSAFAHSGKPTVAADIKIIRTRAVLVVITIIVAAIPHIYILTVYVHTKVAAHP